jgi:hypothetical protein
MMTKTVTFEFLFRSGIKFAERVRSTSDSRRKYCSAANARSVPGSDIEEPYLLFRLLDQRAIAILMAATSLIFVGPRLVSGGEVTVHMDHC